MNDFTSNFARRWVKIFDVGEDFPDLVPRALRRKRCSFWVFKQSFTDGQVLYCGTIKFRDGKAGLIRLVPKSKLDEIIAEGISKINTLYGYGVKT